MTFLYSIFALGSIWFFIISIATIIFLFYCVETEKAIRSLFLIVFYFLFLQFIVQVNLFSNINENPLKSVFYLLGYFVAGFLWSMVKWYLFVNKRALAYKTRRFSFLTEQRASLIKDNQERFDHSRQQASGRYLEQLSNISLETQVPEFLAEEWRHQHNYNDDDSKPEVHENKNKISNWVIYWPVSLIWSLINDFIKKLITAIILKIKFIYQKITNKAYKSIENER